MLLQAAVYEFGALPQLGGSGQAAAARTRALAEPPQPVLLPAAWHGHNRGNGLAPEKRVHRFRHTSRDRSFNYPCRALAQARCENHRFCWSSMPCFRSVYFQLLFQLPLAPVAGFCAARISHARFLSNLAVVRRNAVGNCGWKNVLPSSSKELQTIVERKLFHQATRFFGKALAGNLLGPPAAVNRRPLFLRRSSARAEHLIKVQPRGLSRLQKNEKKKHE